MAEIANIGQSIAVGGTHGKTTTSSMISWLLEYGKLTPGFLIGGVPQNFGYSARLGNSPFFVIEADEYDTAFFDKRSKFVHYRPRTLVINNMEFDHADIFNDLSDIQRQFHHLIRTVPSNGLILANGDEQNVSDTLAKGCWTPVETTSLIDEKHGWYAHKLVADGSEFVVSFQGVEQGTVKWDLIGDFNIENALMAIAAARHVGVPSKIAIEGLSEFVNTKRRMELRGVVNNIAVYDDFAHHPTAISKTLAGLRAYVANRAEKGNILAVLEPRSNTMKSGVHKNTLAASLKDADEVFIYQGEQVQWSVEQLISQCQQPCMVSDDIDELVATIAKIAKPNDHILIMSNGGFGGIHQKLLSCLAG